MDHGVWVRIGVGVVILGVCGYFYLREWWGDKP
jgi:hypothetical protein